MSNKQYLDFCEAIDQFVKSGKSKEVISAWQACFYAGYGFSIKQQEYARMNHVKISSCSCPRDGTLYVFEIG